MRLNSAMKKGIIPFYTLTLAIMCLGFCFGLYRNWEHQLKTTKITLSHDAALTSTFIDNALISTEKSLDLANIQLAARLRSGQHDEATAHHILTTALRNFMLFNASQLYGLMFIVDDQGLLLARTGEYPARIIDFSDRYYYQDLRDHPHKPYTIGPVIKAKMTGKYVFHMAVPILDTQSRFHGVLVQQLQIDDLCDLLGRNYFGLADHIVMHHPTQGLSFVYPPPAKHAIPIKIDVIAQAITKSELKTGAILLDNGS